MDQKFVTPAKRWYRTGLNSFYVPTGQVEEMQCQVCNSTCHVNRKVFCTGSWGEHMAGHKSIYDHFFCPHVGEDWHDSVTELVDEALMVRMDKELDKQNQEYANSRGIRGLYKEFVLWFRGLTHGQ